MNEVKTVQKVNGNTIVRGVHSGHKFIRVVSRKHSTQFCALVSLNEEVPNRVESMQRAFNTKEYVPIEESVTIKN